MFDSPVFIVAVAWLASIAVGIGTLELKGYLRWNR
jgi:hypothetical protein